MIDELDESIDATEQEEQKETAFSELSEREKKKIIKKKLKARRDEVKRILLGNLVPNDDGVFTAGSGFWVTPFGVGDGAHETIAYGVKETCVLYRTTLKNNKQAIYKASNAMADIGRRVRLDTAPNAAVCYIKSYIFRPVVLVFEEGENLEGETRLVLHAYTGRSLFAFVSVSRAVKLFDAALPDEIKRI